MSQWNVRSKQWPVVVSLIAAVLLSVSGSAEDRPLRTLLDVAVTDADNRFVTNLKADDFVLYEGGKVREIQAWTAADAPWNVALMIDKDAWLLTVGSWSGLPPDRSPQRDVGWPWIVDAFASLQGTLRTSDRVAFALFDDEKKIVRDWFNAGDTGKRVAAELVATSEKSQIRPVGSLLSSAQVGYVGKDFYGAIDWIGKRFGNAKGRRDVIAFTDGRDLRLSMAYLRNDVGRPVIDPLFGLPDSEELKEFEEMLRSVRSNGVRVHMASVNADRAPFSPTMSGTDRGSGWPVTMSPIYPGAAQGISAYISQVEARVSRLARATGGAILYSGHAQGTRRVFETLATRLGVGQTYRIEYVSESPETQPLENVEIRVRNPQLRARIWKPEPVLGNGQ